MTKSIKTIGLLGGMGPAASAKMYADLVVLAQKKYHAVQDTDYPPMHIYSLPLVGFDETGITSADSVKIQLCDAAKTLEKAGSDFIVIACNTVHVFIDDIQSSVRVPIFSMIEETVRYIKDLGIKQLGLLSSETTRELNLYQKAFEKAGLVLFQATKQEQKEVTGIIKNVMGGKQGEKDSKVLSTLVNQLAKNGAECVVLGCTELPLAAKNLNVLIPVYDAMTILTSAALNQAYQ
jgi:aspartate racemase